MLGKRVENPTKTRAENYVWCVSFALGSLCLLALSAQAHLRSQQSRHESWKAVGSLLRVARREGVSQRRIFVLERGFTAEGA